METHKPLLEKEKRVAEYHVAHPDARRAECYQQIYRNAKRKTAREKASRLWKREEFKQYVADIALAATAIKAATTKSDRIFEALMNPRSALAIREIAHHVAALEDTLDHGTTPDLVIEGSGKGFTEAREIVRHLTKAEDLSIRRQVINTYQMASKIERDDLKPNAVVNFINVADESIKKGLNNDDILAEFAASDDDSGTPEN
nr:MAG TPA: hypothetical protein [Caudoviricetes sp.]